VAAQGLDQNNHTTHMYKKEKINNNNEKRQSNIHTLKLQSTKLKVRQSIQYE